MKRILLSAFLLCSAFAFAQQNQTVSPEQYAQLKSSGQILQNENYLIVSPESRSANASPSRYSGPVQTQSSACNCLIPLDSTFLVVPFTGCTPPEYRNDDMSSGVFVLPFSFNFYGTNYDTIYINNNGNISFGTAYSVFTANSFPDPTFRMVAPFWADVDTRDLNSGLVYYQLSPTHLVVRWDSVGYFANHYDKLNTFQLIITNGQDTILPPGTNVSFCYGDMQWTTGDASNGSNGFGGSPSTTGVNQGNGTDYFQVTQNDAPGMQFDGPYGATDGVDWLDNLELYFNTALNGNTPPLILNSNICDTIDVYTGDTLRSANIDSIAFSFYFLAPEINQEVTAQFFTNAPASAFSYTLVESDTFYLKYDCVFHAKNLSPGMYYVTATATDNGFPNENTNSSVYIHTYFDPGLSSVAEPNMIANDIAVYPNPTDGNTSISTVNGKEISLMNTLGQIVYAAPVNGTTSMIDMSRLAPGVYVVTVVNTDGTVNKTKLIRQ